VNEPDMNSDKHPNETHVDEMTLLLYVERQLDREAAQGVSLHTQTCTRCLTLLRALDRESRLLTRSMLEQDEPLPARLAEFRAQVKRNMQWIWGVVFGLAVLGIYALYTGYIEPWERQFELAGFGSTNLLSLVVFQGAFWKGWQSMFSLFEVLAVMSLAGFGLFAFRRYLRRGSALAVLFAGFGVLMAVATPASATEFRKGDTVSVKKDEVLKGDLFATGEHVRIDGEVDGDVYAFANQVMSLATSMATSSVSRKRCVSAAWWTEISAPGRTLSPSPAPSSATPWSGTRRSIWTPAGRSAAASQPEAKA